MGSWVRNLRLYSGGERISALEPKEAVVVVCGPTFSPGPTSRYSGCAVRTGVQLFACQCGCGLRGGYSSSMIF
jgi:hypothetical protein